MHFFIEYTYRLLAQIENILLFLALYPEVVPCLLSSRDEVKTDDDDGVYVREHVGVCDGRVVQAPEEGDEIHAPTECRGEHQTEYSRFLRASPAFSVRVMSVTHQCRQGQSPISQHEEGAH